MLCRQLFWVLSYGRNSSIHTMSVENTKNVHSIMKRVNEPKGLAIGIQRRHLFWTALDENDGFRKLYTSDRFGNQPSIICTLTQDLSVYDMAVQGDEVFLTDWKNMALWSLDIKTPGNCQMKVIRRFDTDRPMAVLANESQHTCTKDNQNLILAKSDSLAEVSERPDKEVTKDIIDRACQNYCHNNQKCSITSVGLPVCICETGFAGQHCETFICQDFCLNGGSCQIIGEVDPQPLCLCPNGTFGNRCEKGSTEYSNG